MNIESCILKYWPSSLEKMLIIDADWREREKKTNINIRERLEGDNLYCVSEKFVEPLEELIAEMVISMAF